MWLEPEMDEPLEEDPLTPFTIQDHLNFVREREEERSRNHPPVSLAATQFDVEADQAAYEFTFVNDYGTCTGANKNHEHPHWQN
ncbi:unnamed protein product [Sphagnum troendelagicum]|jgi:hypothetical protein|uniref:Uncharacterized protein n=1 Tax=Sphagnum troendelagicum TaxID=128251 RepID=A0ABP0TJK4_9BRYO